MARDPPSPSVPVAFDGFIDNRSALRGCSGAPARGGLRRRDARVRGVPQARAGRPFADPGQFGVAIYDAKSRTLLLGRDRWGSRSVYWARHRDCLVFASEYKALLTFRDLPARPNLAAIQYVQCTMHGHPYACYLADAQVVPSGSWGNDPRRGGLHSPILGRLHSNRRPLRRSPRGGGRTRSWRPCGSRRRRNVPSGWR